MLLKDCFTQNPIKRTERKAKRSNETRKEEEEGQFDAYIEDMHPTHINSNPPRPSQPNKKEDNEEQPNSVL